MGRRRHATRSTDRSGAALPEGSNLQRRSLVPVPPPSGRDLFALRAVLYPLYIANAPHARFAPCRVQRALPVFQLPLVLFNSFLSLAALRLGARTV